MMADEAYRRGYDRIIWKPIQPIEVPIRTPPARGAFSCPMVISDTMDLTEHVDGRFYDSKSQYRAVTKAHGCIEVGNDKLPPMKRPERPSVRESLKKTLARIS